MAVLVPASGLRRLSCLKHLKPALIMVCHVHGADRARLPARHHRRRADRRCVLKARTAASSTGSTRRGLRADRPIVHIGRLLPRPPVGNVGPDRKDDTKTIDAPYNADNSSGSNLGPTSKKLLERVAGDVDALKKAGATDIPADAVTTSGSGLDPHISPAFAELQIARVAAARHVDAARIQAIVDARTSRPLLGVIGGTNGQRARTQSGP